MLSGDQGTSSELIQLVTPAPPSGQGTEGCWGAGGTLRGTGVQFLGTSLHCSPENSWHFAALHFYFAFREAAPGGGTQQCFTLLASVYLVKTNLSSLPVQRFAFAPAELFSSSLPIL